MMHPLQRWVYENAVELGPVWSAVAAGFAVILWGEVYLTPAGGAYLASVYDEPGTWEKRGKDK